MSKRKGWSARSETTTYVSDPLRGNKRAHAIEKRLRAGHAPRKVAKTLDVPLSEVQRIAALVRRP